MSFGAAEEGGTLQDHLERFRALLWESDMVVASTLFQTLRWGTDTYRETWRSGGESRTMQTSFWLIPHRRNAEFELRAENGFWDELG